MKRLQKSKKLRRFLLGSREDKMNFHRLWKFKLNALEALLMKLEIGFTQLAKITQFE